MTAPEPDFVTCPRDGFTLSPWFVNPRRLTCDRCGYLDPEGVTYKPVTHDGETVGWKLYAPGAFGGSFLRYQWNQIKTICAWCGTVTKEGPPGRVSHGICPPCVVKHFPEVAPEVNS